MADFLFVSASLWLTRLGRSADSRNLDDPNDYNPLRVHPEGLTMEIAGPVTFSGVGVVCRADGTCLERERRYSFTFLPYDVPTIATGHGGSTRPGSMACWVELWGSEPLLLEGEKLRLQMGDGRWIRFHLFDVSDTAPYPHTTIVESWPEIEIRRTIEVDERSRAKV